MFGLNKEKSSVLHFCKELRGTSNHGHNSQNARATRAMSNPDNEVPVLGLHGLHGLHSGAVAGLGLQG